MDIWSSALVSIVLVGSSAGLMIWHVRTWRAARQEVADRREVEYHRRQHRRRMQTSAMLGIVGLAILVGQIVTPWIGSRPFAGFYWSGVILVIAWMGVLALADIVATQHHFTRVRNDCLVERAKLQSEIDHIRAVRGNGKAKRER